MKLRQALTLALVLIALPLSAGAQRAWIDPETGKLGVPPPEENAGEAGDSESAAAPLVVEPGRTEAGGVMVDLRGRPLYEFTATLTPDGEVVDDCIRRDP